MQNKRVMYNVVWQTDRESRYCWEPLKNLSKNHMAVVQDWHVNNPEKLRFGVADLSKTHLIQIKTPGTPLETDTALNGHVIYAHWFLNTRGNMDMFLSPTTNELLEILKDMEYYCSHADPDRQARKRHAEFVYEVDNPPAECGIKYWQIPAEAEDVRRHLINKDTGRLNQGRLRRYRETLLPTLRLDLEREPFKDKPHPRPWVEIGFTSAPLKRKIQHFDDSYTTSALALIRGIQVRRMIKLKAPPAEFVYQPLIELYDPNAAPLLECFRSRICRAYYWLGGLNGTTAGISVRRGLNMTQDEIRAAKSRLDLDLMNSNCDMSISRINQSLIVERAAKNVKLDLLQKELAEAREINVKDAIELALLKREVRGKLELLIELNQHLHAYNNHREELLQDLKRV